MGDTDRYYIIMYMKGRNKTTAVHSAWEHACYTELPIRKSTLYSDRKYEQVLHQEAYHAIWPLLTPKTLIPGLSPQNGRRPVWDQAEPPCKVSRRSVKPRLRNL